jgi:hypothetical protein
MEQEIQEVDGVVSLKLRPELLIDAYSISEL